MDMKVAAKSKGQYDSIKTALLVVIAMFIGPATYGALMAAIEDGDTTKYCMVLGLVVIGVVLILIYRLLVIEEPKEEEEKPKKKKGDVSL
jgi:hypothetical protein